MDDETMKILMSELQDRFAEFSYRLELLYKSHGLPRGPIISTVLMTGEMEGQRMQTSIFRLQNVPSAIADMLLIEGLEKSILRKGEATVNLGVFEPQEDGSIKRERDPKKIQEAIHERLGPGTDECDCDVCKFLRNIRGS